MDESFDISSSDATSGSMSKAQTIAADALRIAALWIAAGALFKLFAGSPNDMPPLVLEYADNLGLGPVNMFRLAITVELLIVILGLFRPRIAWLPMVLLFGFFDFVLWPLVRDGAESCGCFGGAITIKPIVMMTIDSVLLLGILAIRPWSTLIKRPLFPLLLVPLAGAAAILPWQMFSTDVEGSATPASTEIEIPDDTNAAADPVEPAPVTGFALPNSLPDFHAFDPDSWQGQELQSTDLATYLEVDLLPLDCHVVFYRQTCDHCAEHLQELAVQQPEAPLVLVRLVEKQDTPENNVTTVLPTAFLEMELPMLDRGYLLETPSSIDVQGWVVTTFTSHRE